MNEFVGIYRAFGAFSLKIVVETYLDMTVYLKYSSI
jgi:hypothetical protein